MAVRPVTTKSRHNGEVFSSQISIGVNGDAAAGVTIGTVSRPLVAGLVCGSCTLIVPAATVEAEVAGTISMRVGLIPINLMPAKVQPEVPRQFVLPPVLVSASSHIGIVLKLFAIESFTLGRLREMTRAELSSTHRRLNHSASRVKIG